LRRDGARGARYPVHFDEILGTGDPTTNFELLPGDILYVPPTPFRAAAFFIEDILSPVHALLAPITAPFVAVL